MKVLADNTYNINGMRFAFYEMQTQGPPDREQILSFIHGGGAPIRLGRFQTEVLEPRTLTLIWENIDQHKMGWAYITNTHSFWLCGGVQKIADGQRCQGGSWNSYGVNISIVFENQGPGQGQLSGNIIVYELRAWTPS